MPKIVAIHSFRGGTGKSNITANLAATVARSGNRVGIIDTDIHSPGIHVIFGLKEDQVDKALNDYLAGSCSIEDAAYDVSAAARTDAEAGIEPVLFLIPSSLKVGEITRILKEGYDIRRLNEGFRRMIEDLKLDYLFIDTHPGVNEETLLSIAISDLLLVIMRPDNQDFQGTAVTLELARRLKIGELLLLVNKVPSGLENRVLKDHLERTYGAEVAGVFPLNFEIVELASSAIFVLKFPEHPFSDQIRKVADRILNLQ